LRTEVRMLFATTRGAGHVGPLVPFAHACLRAGHDVVVAGPPASDPLVRRANLPFLAVGEPPDRAAAWAPVFAPGEAPGADYVIRELFIGLDARAALPGMLLAVEAWRPDVIVRETCEFASCVAAERFGIPLVQVGIHLDALTDADPGLLALAAPALRELGLEDVDALARTPVVTCAPFGEVPARVNRYRAVNGLPREHPRDLVYMSFGSEAPESSWFPQLYREAIEALADFPVLLTIGDRRDPAELGPLPRRVRVERWVAQDQVMPRAAAVVGHGGSGSTLTALAAGVPLALLPLFVDGPENARRVAEAGAGIVVGQAAALAAAVRELLDEPRYVDAARRIADEIRALPPVSAAVDVLGVDA
jgi:UDP:flavonoid glycosyltransferase YjiC (YdhE family)